MNPFPSLVPQLSLVGMEAFEERPNHRWPGFFSFIETLRSQLAGSLILGNTLPVLNSHPDPRYFDLTLRTTRHTLIVRIRFDNLYLFGFQSENGRWYQLRDRNDQQNRLLIRDATLVDVYQDYSNLEETSRPREGLELGMRPLIHAVDKLARHNPPQNICNRETMALSILVIIQSICEPLRFNNMKGDMVNSFVNGFVVSSSCADLQNKWSVFSRQLIQYDHDRSYSIPPSTAETTGISSVVEAIEELGILAHSNPVVDARRRGHRVNVHGSKRKPLPLAEIYMMHIISKHGGALEGEVVVHNGVNKEKIYENREHLNPGDALLLRGPTEAISGDDPFSIHISLKNRRVNFEDRILWNPFLMWDEFDKPLSAVVGGEMGVVAILRYSVFRLAVEAKVEVSLNMENRTYFSGIIVARNSKFPDHSESFLYKTARDECMELSSCPQLVPLSKSVVATPIDSSLIIEAFLEGYVDGYRVDIVAGKAEFPARSSGKSKKSIFGEYGMVAVKVTWNDDYGQQKMERSE